MALINPRILRDEKTKQPITVPVALKVPGVGSESLRAMWALAAIYHRMRDRSRSQGFHDSIQSIRVECNEVVMMVQLLDLAGWDGCTHHDQDRYISEMRAQYESDAVMPREFLTNFSPHEMASLLFQMGGDLQGLKFIEPKAPERDEVHVINIDFSTSSDRTVVVHATKKPDGVIVIDEVCEVPPGVDLNLQYDPVTGTMKSRQLRPALRLRSEVRRYRADYMDRVPPIDSGDEACLWHAFDEGGENLTVITVRTFSDGSIQLALHTRYDVLSCSLPSIDSMHKMIERVQERINKVKSVGAVVCVMAG